MIKKQTVLTLVDKFKHDIRQELKNNNIELALELIFNCADILYQTNIYYVDDVLEANLRNISGNLNLSHPHYYNKETLLFYDGFGVNDRGLAQIYLQALCKIRKVIYVTYDECKDRIPDILKIIADNDGCKAVFIKRNGKQFKDQITFLNSIVLTETPAEFFFYSIPNDVVATVLLNFYEGKLKRYQVNLTDHAFWLGARCIDTCIEFRDYGAAVSKKYRGLNESQIVKIPFYPEIHSERKFQGFPFEAQKGQKVIFSGGALYKTLGGDNKYYEIVDYILANYKDVIFWYAGSGDDTQLKKIIDKYPNRAYYTEERRDLFQVLKHSRFYLSTYPIVGGLMFQYAAAAGRVPVTLKVDDNRDAGFLQNQDKVEFRTLEELYNEVDKLILDDNYYNMKKKDMVKEITSKEHFTENLDAVLNNKKCGILEIEFKDIKTHKFRKEYLDRLNNVDINMMLANRATFKSAVKHTPIKFFIGSCNKLIRKMQHK